MKTESIWPKISTTCSEDYTKLQNQLRAIKDKLNSNDSKFIRAWVEITEPELSMWTKEWLIKALTK